MPAKKYRVKLSEEERSELLGLKSRGKIAARKLNRIQMLLLADEASESGGWRDADIAAATSVSPLSVERIRKRFVEEGLEGAINPRVSKRVYTRKLDGEAEAFLVATACSSAPEGYASWTMQLLADRLIECEVVDSISSECVRQTLKKTSLNLG